MERSAQKNGLVNLLVLLVVGLLVAGAGFLVHQALAEKPGEERQADGPPAPAGWHRDGDHAAVPGGGPAHGLGGRRPAPAPIG